MTYAIDPDDSNCIGYLGYLVEYPIIANTNPPVIRATNKFATTGRPRLI